MPLVTYLTFQKVVALIGIIINFNKYVVYFFLGLSKEFERGGWRLAAIAQFAGATPWISCIRKRPPHVSRHFSVCLNVDSEYRVKNNILSYKYVNKLCHTVMRLQVSPQLHYSLDFQIPYHHNNTFQLFS